MILKKKVKKNKKIIKIKDNNSIKIIKDKIKKITKDIKKITKNIKKIINDIKKIINNISFNDNKTYIKNQEIFDKIETKVNYSQLEAVFKEIRNIIDENLS
jgi:hypothetical protein